MTRSDPAAHDDTAALWQSWWHAAAGDPVAAQLSALYAALDQAIAAHEPVCFTSGKCCQFDTFGHRLYVTGLEVAWMLAKLTQEQAAPADAAANDSGARHAAPAERAPIEPAPVVKGAGDRQSLPVINGSAACEIRPPRDLSVALHDAPQQDGCPFQVQKKCSTHAVRPLGCRIFYCQQGTDHWQHELYERYLQELRDLHEQAGLEYRYIEWRYALREAALHLPLALQSDRGD